MGDAEREERSRARPSLGQAVLAFSSLLVVFIVCCVKATMPSVLVLGPLSTWLQSWSTSLLRCLSWLVMLLETTRKPGSFQDIFSLPSGRRGVEQAAEWCHHRPGRCPAQH